MTQKRLPYLIVVTVLFLAGCQTNALVAPLQVGPQLAPGQLPQYVVGESFAFDDGRFDTVVAIDGETVTWKNKYGIDVQRYRNFIVPDLSWRTRNRVSSLDTDVIPTDLWPLSPGKMSKRFRAFQTVVWPDGERPTLEFEYEWQCRVTGTKTVTVPAGRYDTYSVACVRFYAGGSIVRQTRTFYYAPALGHFVKRTDDYLTARSRSISLLTAGFNSNVFPREEEADLVRFLFSTLDTTPDDTAKVWRNGTGDVSVSITPYSTYDSDSGEKCRHYRSRYQYAGRTRSNTRTLCQRANGTWYRIQEQEKN